MFPNVNFDTYEKLFKAVLYLLDNTDCVIKLNIASPGPNTNDLSCEVSKEAEYLILDDGKENVILKLDDDKSTDKFISYIVSQFKVENIKVFYPSNILLNTVQPRIVTAATKYGDTIFVSARHYSPAMHSQLKCFDEETEVKMMNRGQVVQGFIDQFDRFYNREEALEVAKAAGQLNTIRFKTRPFDELFSEDLH